MGTRPDISRCFSLRSETRNRAQLVGFPIKQPVNWLPLLWLCLLAATPMAILSFLLRLWMHFFFFLMLINVYSIHGQARLKDLNHLLALIKVVIYWSKRRISTVGQCNREFSPFTGSGLQSYSQQVPFKRDRFLWPG